MAQEIDSTTKLAAMAVRMTSGACQQAGREVGCRYCFSTRHRGCVFIAEKVLDAILPSPGSDGDGTPPGIKQRMAA